MKKILIMMALIVGFGVSAQKKPKIKNVKVEFKGEDVILHWNHIRARKAEWANKHSINPRTESVWPIIKSDWDEITYEGGDSFGVNLGPNVKDATYVLRATRGGRDGKPDKYAHKKVRISKLVTWGKYYTETDNRGYYSFMATGHFIFKLQKKTIRLGGIDHDFLITLMNHTNPNGTRIQVSVPKGMTRTKLDSATHIWFKQTIW